MVDRVRVTWSGFAGSPGVSTFYATDGALAVGPISTFFSTLSTAFPGAVNISTAASGDTIDPITGLISGSWSGGTPTPSVGTGASGFSAPAGASVRWLTAGIVAGHRVKGRTFLVPLTAAGYQDNGTLTTTLVAEIQSAANALVAALPTDLFVWSRPAAATPSWTDVRGVSHPARAARVGSVYPITAAQAVDKAVVLRSRRD